MKVALDEGNWLDVINQHCSQSVLSSQRGEMLSTRDQKNLSRFQ